MEVTGTVDKSFSCEVLYARDCDFQAPVSGVRRMFLTNCTNVECLFANEPDVLYASNCKITRLPKSNYISLRNCEITTATDGQSIKIVNCRGVMQIRNAYEVNITESPGLIIMIERCHKLRLSGSAKMNFRECDNLHLYNVVTNCDFTCRDIVIDSSVVVGTLRANTVKIINSKFNSPICANTIVIDNCTYNQPTTADSVKILNCDAFNSDIHADSVEIINCDAFCANLYTRKTHIISPEKLKIETKKT